MNTFVSIGLATVLSTACGAALAQQTSPPAEPTQQAVQPAQPAQRLEPITLATPKTESAPARAASAADAAKESASQHMALQAMDTNKDGLVSKTEYMAHYEGLFGTMKKNSAGMISLKDLG